MNVDLCEHKKSFCYTGTSSLSTYIVLKFPYKMIFTCLVRFILWNFLGFKL